MRRITDALRAAAAAMLAAAAIAVGAGNSPAADDADGQAAPGVVDSGWAVSSADAKPGETKPQPKKPLLKKPGAKKTQPKKLAEKSAPRVAAKPSTGLKWMPAGVVGKSADEKPETATPPAKFAKKQAPSKDNGKPAGSNTETKTPPAGKTAPAVPAPAADDAEELKEPALFPRVIEIDEEPQAKAAEPSKDSRVATAPRPKPAESKPGEPKPAEPKPQTTSAQPEVLQAAPQPLRPLTRYQRSLRSRLRSVLAYYYRRPLNSVDHDPWEVMHNMLAYGQHSRILEGDRRGRPMTAVGFLCYNMPAQRKQMMTLTADGVIETRVAVGMQGHKGQLLAMLAQCDVSADYPMRVDDAKLTIHDLIDSEKLSCYAGEELTFKLIGLMHYLNTDATWVNDQGETWNFPRLIEEERTQKIRGAACGGTHRLSGLSLAVRKRRELGEPIDGEYREAERFVQQYVNYAYRWQNRDGSLSTEWFRGPGDEEDINRRVRTTGHLLEWLLYTIPDEQLTSSATVRSVNYLTGLLASNTSNPWEIGPLSHALHALVLYDERVFQPHDPGLIAAAKRSGRRSMSPENLNYKNIDSRVVASMLSKDEAELARAELERASSGLRGLFGNRRRSTQRTR